MNILGVIVGQYLQNVTSRVALGAELLYQYGSQVPGGQIGLYTLAGRYSGMCVYIQNLIIRVYAKNVCIL